MGKKNSENIEQAKEKTRTKISVRRQKMSELEEGTEFGGKYCGIVKGQPFTELDKETGEVKEKILTSVIFANEETGDRTAFLADTGFLQTIAEAMVKEGDVITCVKLEKVRLSRGRTMNQYDIFV